MYSYCDLLLIDIDSQRIQLKAKLAAELEQFSEVLAQSDNADPVPS
ncbi:hypothetical protein [Marinomonas transparens]|uniref:Uncharacterized protein n=1 Tax=Marinomonas transparens TaxID=2795388 RepID=A0A934N6Z4_9GAMM|nr:hypothetical protein [Marinomonas transparens]MBJ7538541.1 hypothetical protein [Marinomonas transparens]